MRLLPASPRRRRRLAGWAAAAGLAGALAAVSLFFPSTSAKHPEAAPGGRPQVYVAPASVPFAGSRREAARAVMRAFLRAAVLRRDPAASYDLVTPELRQGISREQWASGAIPVVPYAADAVWQVREKLDYSYRDEVALDLLFLPKPGSTARSAAFTIKLRAVGPAGRKRWLVSSWAPVGTLNPAVPGGRAPLAAGETRGRLGAVWLLVPVGIFAGLVGILVLALLGRAWRDRLRARRIAVRP